jgi:HEPN domain-containing protein
MAEDGEASNYLQLSHDYIAGARAMAEANNFAPARFLSIHALELGLKAVLTSASGLAPKVHNVGGEFGRRHRDRVGATVVRRINRLLDDYNAPRYPDWESPEPAVIIADIEFIEAFLRKDAPDLMRGPS